MSELTPEKLGELSGDRKVPPSVQSRPRRQTVSDTVTAKGSPLTDPEGVKGGEYSYSETVGENMEDDNIMTKSISQLIAERQGTAPRGAFSKSIAFEKALNDGPVEFDAEAVGVAYDAMSDEEKAKANESYRKLAAMFNPEWNNILDSLDEVAKQKAYRDGFINSQKIKYLDW